MTLKPQELQKEIATESKTFIFIQCLIQYAVKDSYIPFGFNLDNHDKDIINKFVKKF